MSSNLNASTFAGDCSSESLSLIDNISVNENSPLSVGDLLTHTSELFNAQEQIESVTALIRNSQDQLYKYAESLDEKDSLIVDRLINELINPIQEKLEAMRWEYLAAVKLTTAANENAESATDVYDIEVSFSNISSYIDDIRPMLTRLTFLRTALAGISSISDLLTQAQEALEKMTQQHLSVLTQLQDINSQISAIDTTRSSGKKKNPSAQSPLDSLNRDKDRLGSSESSLEGDIEHKKKRISQLERYLQELSPGITGVLATVMVEDGEDFPDVDVLTEIFKTYNVSIPKIEKGLSDIRFISSSDLQALFNKPNSDTLELLNLPVKADRLKAKKTADLMATITSVREKLADNWKIPAAAFLLLALIMIMVADFTSEESGSTNPSRSHDVHYTPLGGEFTHQVYSRPSNGQLTPTEKLSQTFEEGSDAHRFGQYLKRTLPSGERALLVAFRDSEGNVVYDHNESAIFTAKNEKGRELLEFLANHPALYGEKVISEYMRQGIAGIDVQKGERINFTFYLGLKHQRMFNYKGKKIFLPTFVNLPEVRAVTTQEQRRTLLTTKEPKSVQRLVDKTVAFMGGLGYQPEDGEYIDYSITFQGETHSLQTFLQHPDVVAVTAKEERAESAKISDPEKFKPFLDEYVARMELQVQKNEYIDHLIDIGYPSYNKVMEDFDNIHDISLFYEYLESFDENIRAYKKYEQIKETLVTALNPVLCEYGLDLSDLLGQSSESYGEQDIVDLVKQVNKGIDSTDYRILYEPGSDSIKFKRIKNTDSDSENEENNPK